MAKKKLPDWWPENPNTGNDGYILNRCDGWNEASNAIFKAMKANAHFIVTAANFHERFMDLLRHELCSGADTFAMARQLFDEIKKAAQESEK